MFEIDAVDKRIKRKLSIGEFAALIFVFSLAVYLTLTHTGYFWDYKNILASAKGDTGLYFYGYWLLPLFYLFSTLPFEAGYLIWASLGILGVWFAARVFNGRSVLTLISYQLSYALFWGQISGILCGVLALFWWAMHRRKWELAGFALLIAAAKPQTGGMFAFLLWVFADISWREKLRICIIPAAGVLLTFVFYPGWISNILSRIGNAIAWGNISLWQWIGPWALLFFLPALIIPMGRQRRFLALASAGILAVPYFLQTDLLTLFIFPIGILPVLLGYLPGIMLQFFSFAGQPSGVIVPLSVYLWQTIPGLAAWFKKKRLSQT